MAASTSITNFLSFFTPSKAPPPPKTSISHLSLSSSDSPLPSLSSSSKTRDALVPLVASGDDHRPLSHEINQVINPGFAYANTLFFNAAYNVQVIVGENEPEEKLLGRFRREVMRAGVIQECKRRRYFENKQDKEKRKARDAAKRNRRRRPFAARPSFQDKQEGAAAASKKEDDSDNCRGVKRAGWAGFDPLVNGLPYKWVKSAQPI